VGRYVANLMRAQWLKVTVFCCTGTGLIPCVFGKHCGARPAPVRQASPDCKPEKTQTISERLLGACPMGQHYLSFACREHRVQRSHFLLHQPALDPTLRCSRQTQPSRACSLNLDVSFFLIYLFIYFFWWDWSLNSVLCTCKAGALLLEPHLKSILLWLFFGDGVSQTVCQEWPQTSILPISDQVLRCFFISVCQAIQNETQSCRNHPDVSPNMFPGVQVHRKTG
jgi:hypothetical protein